MIRSIVWRDLRWRLLAALLLVAPLAWLVAWSYVALARSSPISGSYIEFLDAAWFRLPGPSAVFLLAAVVVSAGGALLRPRDDVAYLLALPISRRRLLLAHVGASLAALAALVLVVALVLASAAWGARVPLEVGPLLARSLAVFLAASVWVGVMTAVVTLVRHPVLALTIVIGSLVILPSNRFRLEIPPIAPSSMLPSWDPWAFTDPRAWQGARPLLSLLTAFALGVAAMVLASYRMDRYEP
jgi:hypothetical protein